MAMKKYITPEYITADEIKKIRKTLGLTQREFAVLVGISQSSVERWEAGNTSLTGPLVLLMELLAKHPEYLQEITVPAKVYPLRLWYMHKQTVCTLIDVDEVKQELEIRNYTDNLMFRAFGIVEHPDYEMYTEFLKSRCFPESRDKMKLVLQDLNLPFYDPFMIIEKTEGRMAEDDFWIKIER
ncbi:MAG: type II toxin-antitoxin system MqsA family antitoxin [Lachnospiraceae bacterium]|nr:type II toxin-antitoxin system MqsA family antitoxin [Lachnospiraceae bacterium]